MPRPTATVYVLYCTVHAKQLILVKNIIQISFIYLFMCFCRKYFHTTSMVVNNNFYKNRQNELPKQQYEYSWIKIVVCLINILWFENDFFSLIRKDPPSIQSVNCLVCTHTQCEPPQIFCEKKHMIHLEFRVIKKHGTVFVYKYIYCIDERLKCELNG